MEATRPIKTSNNKSLINKFMSLIEPVRKTKLKSEQNVEPIVSSSLTKELVQTEAEPKTEKIALDSKPIKMFDEKLQADLDLIENISKFLKETSNENEELLNLKENKIDKSSIDVLPNELICKILDYLDFNERKIASLVCKKWRSAFLESHYLKDATIKASNHLFVSSRPSSATQMHSSKSVNSLPSNLSSSKHRTASSMALSSFSSINQFNYQLYNNLVNLEFDNDSADVNLLLNNLNNTRQNKNNALLPKLKYLKFFKTSMSSKCLVEILSQSPNLESLNLIHCDSLFMTGFLTVYSNDNLFDLKNLKELSLSKNRYLTDFLLNLFLNSVKNLEILDLSFCNLTKTNFKSITNANLNLLNQNQKSSSVVLTIENLLLNDIILNKIKSINLSGIEFFNHDDESLLKLIEKLSNLQHLYLSYLPSLKVETVIKILELKPDLNLLDLNNSIQVDDLNKKSVEHCLEKSKLVQKNLISNLQVLKLSKAKINNPKLFADQILCLTKLTYLDLSCIMFQYSFSNANQVNQFIEEFAFNLSKCEKLENLLLSYCDFMINDTFIKIISKKLKNLKHLDLRNCSQITDQSLHYISTYLTKLAHLDISWCQKISDYGLNKTIEIDKTQSLLNDFNNHLNSSCRCIKKYNQQQFLLIKTKYEIKSGIKKQFCLYDENDEHKNDIKNEKVENENDQDQMKSDISLKNLKYLKVLRMESCVNISDLGLYNGVNLSQLNELDIKLCTNINGDFVYNYLKEDLIETSSKKLFNNLKILNLNQCIKFKEDNLMFILERSPNLRELSIGAIPQITNRLIELLIKIKKFLVLLDISFCPSVNEPCVEKYEQFLFNEYGLREFFLDKRFISK